MASQIKSSKPDPEPDRWDPDDPGIDRTLIEIIEYLEEEHELRENLEMYRQGGAVMSLCSKCGIPLPAGLSLGEWVQVPLICRYCLTEI